MLQIITGGQTGADQTAWRTACAFGVATGGRVPRGWLTEEGPRPEFAELFGATEMPTSSYPLRTEMNVRESDAVLWFGSLDTQGAKTTLTACEAMRRPNLIVTPARGVKPIHAAEWIQVNDFKTMNVAGNRESKQPGIGARVEAFMIRMFRELGYHRIEA